MEAPRPGAVRAVLFDAVGTLILPVESVAATYCRLAQPLGSQSSEAEIAGRFAAALTDDAGRLETSEECERQRWRWIVGQAVPELAATDADQLFQQLWEYYASPLAWRLFPEVPSLWSQLSAAGLILGIASNFDHRLHQVRRGHPPLDDVESCFVSSEIGYRKPSQQFFKAIEERLELEPGEILLVGDEPQLDYKAARAACWQAVLVDRSCHSLGDLLMPLLGRGW